LAGIGTATPAVTERGPLVGATGSGEDGAVVGVEGDEVCVVVVEWWLAASLFG
jgi:hypothetical protein